MTSVPPYSFDKKLAKDLTKPIKDRDEVDRLVSEQIRAGQTPSFVMDLCPNPWHPRRAWHGFREGYCPGSHVGVYEKPGDFEDNQLMFDFFPNRD